MLLKLFWVFLKIGLFTFGGGYAMIPLINAEVVGAGWLSEEGLIDFIAVSESSPGPFAVNIATFVGIRTAGILGGVTATMGVALPSFVIILLVARFYEAFKKAKSVQGIMTGLRPCVVGMIAYAGYTVAVTLFSNLGHGMTTVTNIEFWFAAVVFVLSLVLVLKKVPPIAVIVLCAVAGIIVGYAFGI